MTLDEFNHTIIAVNPGLRSLVEAGETFHVLSMREQKRSVQSKRLFQASVRVSPVVRKFIEKQDDYLSIGLYRCKVYDHFYIKRCNHCQQYGHYKANCKAPTPVCGHCTGSHESESCTKKKAPDFTPSCINCKKSKNDSSMHSHSAIDRSCPTYQNEQQRLKKSIPYYNSSKN